MCVIQCTNGKQKLIPLTKPVNPTLPPQIGTKLTTLHFILVTYPDANRNGVPSLLYTLPVASLPPRCSRTHSGFLFHWLCQFLSLDSSVAPSISLLTLLCFTICSSLSLLHFTCNYCLFDFHFQLLCQSSPYNAHQLLPL